jgi:hypothetical protein
MPFFIFSKSMLHVARAAFVVSEFNNAYHRKKILGWWGQAEGPVMFWYIGVFVKTILFEGAHDHFYFGGRCMVDG